jgi:glucarate dehydratase
MDSLPKITKMTVIPVAGYDSFLLNLSGGHGPVFIRNLIILQDNAGHTGVGETPGGQAIERTLRASQDLVVGSMLGRINDLLSDVAAKFHTLDAGGRGQQTFDQRVMIHALTGIEAACLDLLGQILGVPVAQLLGEGQQRERVDVLGYLFFVGDSGKTNLDYETGQDSDDSWQSLRRRETLDARGVVAQALALQERFGFSTFKLKGGVLAGEAECDCILALAEALPQAGLTIDPNGCWSLQQAVEWLSPLKSMLTYAEDPCGPERGHSGREVLAEFRRQTAIATATNMVATDFPSLVQAIRLQAVDIPLADCHFWTMQGAVRVSMLCQLWGMTWGSHSNNHFDVSLAMMTHVAAAATGKVTPIDSHWIWQIGQRLTKQPFVIEDGGIEVPTAPGLGIALDFEKVEQAHQLYERSGIRKRDDFVAMQFLQPGWTFDPKRPCLLFDQDMAG